MKYKTPFVNYPLQYHLMKKEIDGTIKRILEHGDLILRKDVQDFEKRFSSFVGTKYGIGVGSCTDALFLSLFAAGVRKGDEVITVSHTYVATIDTIWACGAKPVLIDCNSETYCIDVTKIEAARLTSLEYMRNQGMDPNDIHKGDTLYFLYPGN